MRVVGVVPLHNHWNWVWGAVESLAHQDHDDKAIVVVNDGSSDNSLDAVLSRLYKPVAGQAHGLPENPQAWKGRVPGVNVDVFVLDYKTPHGPAYARNRGMELGASIGADAFALLDSDDVYKQGKVSKSVRYLEEFPEVGVVYSDYETIRPDGLITREFKEPYSRRRLMQECLINCDSVVSRAAAEACAGFDEELRVAEDYDLWVRCTEKFAAVHIPEPLVVLRVGSHSSTSSVQKKVWEQCWRRVMEKAQARANQ